MTLGHRVISPVLQRRMTGVLAGVVQFSYSIFCSLNVPAGPVPFGSQERRQVFGTDWR